MAFPGDEMTKAFVNAFKSGQVIVRGFVSGTVPTLKDMFIRKITHQQLRSHHFPLTGRLPLPAQLR